MFAEFAKHPIACLTLASYLPSNTGDVARKYIKDPELLNFIDIECYCWSTVLAEHTPLINAGMVSTTCFAVTSSRELHHMIFTLLCHTAMLDRPVAGKVFILEPALARCSVTGITGV